MTHQDLIAKIREAGMLALQKQEIEAKIKTLKAEIATAAHLYGHTEESKTDNRQLVVSGVNDFTCKVYERTQFFASQEKARELLHPNTFNAIFTPTTSEVVDIRPTAETKRKGTQLVMRENESKVA